MELGQDNRLKLGASLDGMARPCVKGKKKLFEAQRLQEVPGANQRC